VETRRRRRFSKKKFQFFIDEAVVAVLDVSRGDDGTVPGAAARGIEGAVGRR
jgi:hypothetical protein